MARPNRPVVLIVDADEARRRQLAAALAGAGYAVLPARTPAEAGRMEHSFRPLAAAVLDMDGPAALAALRQADRELPIIGHGSAATSPEPRLTQYLPRPAGAEQLVALIGQVARPVRDPPR